MKHNQRETYSAKNFSLSLTRRSVLKGLGAMGALALLPLRGVAEALRVPWACRGCGFEFRGTARGWLDGICANCGCEAHTGKYTGLRTETFQTKPRIWCRPRPTERKDCSAFQEWSPQLPFPNSSIAQMSEKPTFGAQKMSFGKSKTRHRAGHFTPPKTPSS